MSLIPTGLTRSARCRLLLLSLQSTVRLYVLPDANRCVVPILHAASALAAWLLYSRVSRRTLCVLLSWMCFPLRVRTDPCSVGSNLRTGPDIRTLRSELSLCSVDNTLVMIHLS